MTIFLLDLIFFSINSSTTIQYFAGKFDQVVDSCYEKERGEDFE